MKTIAKIITTLMASVAIFGITFFISSSPKVKEAIGIKKSISTEDIYKTKANGYAEKSGEDSIRGTSDSKDNTIDWKNSSSSDDKETESHTKEDKKKSSDSISDKSYKEENKDKANKSKPVNGYAESPSKDDKKTETKDKSDNKKPINGYADPSYEDSSDHEGYYYK